MMSLLLSQPLSNQNASVDITRQTTQDSHSLYYWEKMCKSSVNTANMWMEADHGTDHKLLL